MSWFFNTTQQRTALSNSTFTDTYTYDASATLLVAFIFSRSDVTRKGSKPTFNLSDMTDSGEGFLFGEESYGTDIWHLLNPPTSTPCTLSVLHSYSDTIRVNVFSFSETGTPSKDNSNSGPSTSNVSSIKVVTNYYNSLMVTILCSGDIDTPFAGTNYTLVYTDDHGNQVIGNEYDLYIGNAGTIAADTKLLLSKDI